MDKITIGQTGITVTKLGFGAAPLAGMPDTYGHDVSEEDARATVRAVFESPVNMLDVSRNYGMGRAEDRIGAVIRERGGLPEGFVLATKLDRDMDTGRFDGDQARRSAEESLTALGIDKFQILHLHDPEYARDLDEVTRKGGAIDTLFRMKEEGLVQAVGLAMGRTDILLPLLKGWDFDIVLSHNRYSLLNRSAQETFDYAASKGIAVFNAAPFAGGVLAKGSANLKRVTYQEATEATLAPIRKIEDICGAHNLAPGAAALQFSMQAPLVDATIVGISKPERVAQTLAWAETTLSPDAVAALASVPFTKEDPEASRVYVPG